MPLTVLYRQIFVLTLLLIAACSVPPDEDPEIIVTLDPEFTVDLFEQRAADDGREEFGLWIESMAQVAWSNYRIEATVAVTADKITVQLEEVSPPDSCLGSPGPARGFLPVGPLADGVYRFCFALNPVILNEGILEVKNGRYALSLPNQQGIDFQNRVLHTLPEGYVWGYADTPSESDLPVADQFLQNLKPLTQEPGLPPGFYAYFPVSGSGQYFFRRSIAPAGQHRPFLRRLSGSPAAVRDLLQGVRNDPGHPLSVFCLSTFGAL